MWLSNRHGLLGIFFAFGIGVTPLAAAVQAEGQPAEKPAAQNTCLVCHSHLGGQLASPTGPFPTDVHAEKGLTCASCHGGDPTSMDIRVAMNPARGFRGRPSRQEIPAFCGRCHSNADYMHRFNPTAKTDQVAQYNTSVHGKRLREGDRRVAVCINCHSVHDIKMVNDPTSPVYPTNVPDTCGKCHSDREYMQGYNLPNLSQVEDYQNSVHYRALTVEGNLAAPTCQSCHGSHGATPPGVTSVADVCGTCHAHNRDLFEKSPHRDAFASLGAPGCVQCHSNHAIQPAGEHMLVGPGSICLTCHAPDDNGGQRAQEMAASIQKLDSTIQQTRDTLEQAERAGVDMSLAMSELTNAHSRLVMARTTVHSLDSTKVAAETTGGLRIASEIAEEGKQKLAELRRFREGLALSTVFILGVVLTLYFYIRQNGYLRKEPGGETDE
ncbi:MAG: cytochrome c3 family protein [Acidobacteria bacterium]|nr:cytochrome c3 family protein [Acidobacteriota bacterium]